MAFHIRNRKTEKLARELAGTAGLGLTEAVHLALENELRRRQRAISLWERSADIRTRVERRVVDARPVDKAFRDSLYGDERSRVR